MFLKQIIEENAVVDMGVLILQTALACQIQTILGELGYFAGTANGQFDDTSRLALENFQRSHNLIPGYLNRETAKTLILEEAKFWLNYYSQEPLVQPASALGMIG